ncbi:MAG: SseB family protein [Cryobacterium sp.]|nr:SseB family protein [Cryobacterium sp.]
MTEHDHGHDHGDLHAENLGDSAGQPWAGRSFTENPHAEDSGEIDPVLRGALTAFREGRASQADVVDALRSARLLIPLLAELGDEGPDTADAGDAGKRVDKSQELSIVTVAGPDGRTVLPVFSSVAAMGLWNPTARPVPADGIRVALAAASEQTDVVVLDAGSEARFVVRRPALWAMAKQEPWVPAAESADVVAEFERSTAGEPVVVGVAIEAGDPQAVLAGPELIVRLALQPGLDATALHELLARLADRWAESELIAAAVDSVEVALRSAVPPV